MAQVLANFVAIILFLSVHFIVKKLLQKRSFGIKDEKIIRLFFLSLERATLFPGQLFSILLIFEVSVITEILAFFGQLSIIYSFPLQLKHCLFFMSQNISASEFWVVGVIVPQSVLNRHKKEMLLLDIVCA